MEQNGVWANSKENSGEKGESKFFGQQRQKWQLGGDINKLRKEINELLDSEEIKWQQRSKVQ